MWYLTRDFEFDVLQSSTSGHLEEALDAYDEGTLDVLENPAEVHFKTF